MTKKDLTAQIGQLYTDQLIQYARRVKDGGLHKSKAKKWSEATLLMLTLIKQMDEKQLTNLLDKSKESKSPLFVQSKLF